MKLILTPQESEDLFYDSLCNAVGTGYMDAYGLEMSTRNEDYRNAKNTFPPFSSPAYEDILMEVLRQGGELTFVDHESDGEYTQSVTLADVHTRINEALDRGTLEFSTVLEAINGEGDAGHADSILQTVFYKEIIFG